MRTPMRASVLLMTFALVASAAPAAMAEVYCGDAGATANCVVRPVATPLRPGVGSSVGNLIAYAETKITDSSVSSAEIDKLVRKVSYFGKLTRQRLARHYAGLGNTLEKDARIVSKDLTGGADTPLSQTPED